MNADVPSTPGTEHLALGASVRGPRDLTDPRVPVAATAVLLRDSDAGAQVLMLRRHDHGSFPGAWVFPGGKVDPGDRIARAEAEVEIARRAAVRETKEETGLSVSGAGLRPVALWDPPPGLPLRIRTWFFLGAAPNSRLLISEDEAVEHDWVLPNQMLERHGRGERVLYPPTWVMLRRLTEAGGFNASMTLSFLASLWTYETTSDIADTTATLVWSVTRSPGQLRREYRLELATLPWSLRASTAPDSGEAPSALRQDSGG